MNEDKITQKLLEQDKQFDRIGEKLDKTLTREEYLQGQDEVMVILRRLDQERIFTAEWVKRIEREVKQHSIEIAKMKQVLKIA